MPEWMDFRWYKFPRFFKSLKKRPYFLFPGGVALEGVPLSSHNYSQVYLHLLGCANRDEQMRKIWQFSRS